MQDLDLLREWTGHVSNIANAYKKSQILFTAFDAGIFDLLESERSAADVASVLGWSERGTGMLLDGLLALDLVRKRDGRYQNAPMASACLAREGEVYQGNILRHSEGSWNAWAALADRVRTGACEPPGDRWTGDGLRNFILGMSNIAKLSAREVLEMVDLSEFRHMLDLAGGPATYAIAFLQANSEMKATLFDFPDVVNIAREQVAKAGLESRFDYRAGNCLEDDLGRGYDLVFVSNLIHSFSLEENGRLVRRVYDALEPGGAIIIKDFILDNDRSGPPFSLIFALHMLIHTPGGGTYTFDEVQAWTDAAGFEPGKALSLTPQTRLWIARKPR